MQGFLAVQMQVVRWGLNKKNSTRPESAARLALIGQVVCATDFIVRGAWAAEEASGHAVRDVPLVCLRLSPICGAALIVSSPSIWRTQAMEGPSPTQDGWSLSKVTSPED